MTMEYGPHVGEMRTTPGGGYEVFDGAQWVPTNWISHLPTTTNGITINDTSALTYTTIAPQIQKANIPWTLTSEPEPEFEPPTEEEINRALESIREAVHA